MDPEQRDSILDEEYLRLLPLGFWVSGGVTLLVSLYFLLYAVLGTTFFLTPLGSESESPEFIGVFLMAFGFIGFLIVATFGVLKIRAGFWLRKSRHRTTTMVLAGISCLEVPYGTLLGVLTLIALSRPSMKARFQPLPPAPSPVPITTQPAEETGTSAS